MDDLIEQGIHVEDWKAHHEEELAKFSTLLNGENKVVVVEGPIHSGKTTLAVALQKSWKESEQGDVYLTTAAIQENLDTAPPIRDRSGAIYKKLPPIEEVSKSPQSVIVIDEASAREPFFEKMWKKYINLPNTLFILLVHPGSPATKKWLSLFPSNSIVQYRLNSAVGVS